ncbi:SAF domain-containing protein [Georgenia muralis]|uniref:Flp pilus assembly protein CpaB n=1 Tax=Georgenia muralis TaxID=154117 RepID=A0A3N4Z0L0_9MICO|nr:SAF domain-containing protein [Georgenia muralis]RPF26137.1 Flp pilus assembly protein CpaB [Georgenia muralis]
MRRETVPSRSAAAVLRRTLWRGRHLLAALCLGLAVSVIVSTLAPPPPAGVPVLSLARAVPAGTVLTDADVTRRTLPASAAPTALTAPADAVGRTLAVGLPAGTALVESMLVGPGLAGAAPAGTVVVPVPLADAGSAALAEPGRRVTLVAADSDLSGTAGAARVVARDVVVLAVHRPEAGGNLLDPGASGVTVIFVAAREADATALVGAGAWAPLRAVIR